MSKRLVIRPDELLSNADWPKRTKDDIDGLEPPKKGKKKAAELGTMTITFATGPETLRSVD